MATYRDIGDVLFDVETSRGSGCPDQQVCVETIDPMILPLVVALNATGAARTRASCQGHWIGLVARTELYIVLNAKASFAERLGEVIHVAWRSGHLCRPWTLIPFEDDDDLFRYRLSAEHGGVGLVGMLASVWPARARAFRGHQDRHYEADIAVLIRVIATLHAARGAIAVESPTWHLPDGETLRSSV